ncbi:hypothetical protein ISCGN_020072 [Ixodes scapularis]
MASQLSCRSLVVLAFLFSCGIAVTGQSLFSGYGYGTSGLGYGTSGLGYGTSGLGYGTALHQPLPHDERAAARRQLRRHAMRLYLRKAGATLRRRETQAVSVVQPRRLQPLLLRSYRLWRNVPGSRLHVFRISVGVSRTTPERL